MPRGDIYRACSRARTVFACVDVKLVVVVGFRMHPTLTDLNAMLFQAGALERIIGHQVDMVTR